MANPTGNTEQCFTEFIGQKVVGYLPGPIKPHSYEAHTLVFEDGRGLGVSDKGTFWVVPAKDIRDRVDSYTKELEETQRNIEQARSLAGVLNGRTIEAQLRAAEAKDKPKKKGGKKGAKASSSTGSSK